MSPNRIFHCCGIIEPDGCKLPGMNTLHSQRTNKHDLTSRNPAVARARDFGRSTMDRCSLFVVFNKTPISSFVFWIGQKALSVGQSTKPPSFGATTTLTLMKFFVLLAACVSSLALSTLGADGAVTLTHSLVKLRPDYPVPLAAAVDSISAAANEYESFQIAVSADSDGFDDDTHTGGAGAFVVTDVAVQVPTGLDVLVHVERWVFERNGDCRRLMCLPNRLGGWLTATIAERVGSSQWVGLRSMPVGIVFIRFCSRAYACAWLVGWMDGWIDVDGAPTSYINITVVSNCQGSLGRWPDALVPLVDPFVNETRDVFPLTVPVGSNQVRAPYHVQRNPNYSLARSLCGNPSWNTTTRRLCVCVPCCRRPAVAVVVRSSVFVCVQTALRTSIMKEAGPWYTPVCRHFGSTCLCVPTRRRAHTSRT